jgi:hypothetical protein
LLGLCLSGGMWFESDGSGARRGTVGRGRRGLVLMVQVRGLRLMSFGPRGLVQAGFRSRLRRPRVCLLQVSPPLPMCLPQCHARTMGHQ